MSLDEMDFLWFPIQLCAQVFHIAELKSIYFYIFFCT